MTILECHRVLAAVRRKPPRLDVTFPPESVVAKWVTDFTELFLTRWIEATERLDRAAARVQRRPTVQRRPRAHFVGVVDETLGVSAPNGHLYMQKSVKVLSAPPPGQWKLS